MKNILIIKLGALGDTVMASAMLPAIRSRWPHAKVTWMAGAGATQILQALHDPPEIFTVDDTALLQGSLYARLREISRVIHHFSGQKYSLILVPYRSRLYHLLRVGVRADALRSFSHKRSLIPGRYQPAEYVRLVLGHDGPEAPHPVFPALRNDLLHMPHTSAVPDVLLMPGGAKNLLADTNVRRWPLEHYAALAKKLIQHSLSVGIIGGPEDAWAQSAFTGIPVTDYTGKLGIHTLIGTLAATRLLVTHDTGPMHLMALVGGKIVAMFGATDPQTFAPRHTATILSAPGFIPCRPCYDGKNFACCPQPRCMSDISPDTVLHSALAALSRTE